MKKMIKQNIAVAIIQIIIFLIILFFSFRNHMENNSGKADIIHQENSMTQKDF